MSFSEAEFRGGFEENEFFPYFQPLVELRTGQIPGLEALARWDRGVRGMVSPDEFIPVLEKLDLIDNLTKMILEKAFASPVFADGSLTLCVNISPIQLRDFKLPELIASAAEAGAFSLDRLTIEITESALVDDLPRARAVALELKALHCRLALDDFGTGYSSLKHLHALPFDELKVDKSFVSSMTGDRESRKIVASVIGLGQSLNLQTVAEGVETQEQANLLFWMGCDLAQGWLYGAAVPSEEIPDLIAGVPKKFSVHLPDMAHESLTMGPDALPGQRLAQLQAIYDGAPVGLCLLDEKMRYVSLNRRLAQMNGAPAAAHLGKTPAEVIPHVFRQVEPFIRRALKGESITGVEVQKPKLEEGEAGQTLLISYQPARDEAGEVLGVSVAIMDISERKKIERALRESEEHFRNMMKLSPHVPWVLNSNGEVTEASPRWEEITGQAMDDAMGNGWLAMLHPDDVPRAKKAIETSLSTGQPIDIEYRIRRPGKEWIWMRSRGSPRFGPSGKIVCIYGVVEEIHAHKGTTQELETPRSISAIFSACGVAKCSPILRNSRREGISSAGIG